MLIKIAWRNLWRNRRRTLIVLTSIIVGVVIILLNDGLAMGMIRQMLDNQINLSITHLQIHKNGFNEDKVLSNYMEKPEYVDSILKKLPFVKSYSKRLINFGIISSASNSSGVILNGVEFERESKITIIEKSIVAGKYLSGKVNEIVIGKKLAERLEVELGDKLVAVSSNNDGEPSSELFRIVGIFKTPDSEFDKINVFVNFNHMKEMLGVGEKVAEFAIIIDEPEKVDSAKKELLKAINSKNYEVLSYIDLLPLIMSFLDSYKAIIVIFYVIFGMAVFFGVVNTMLMSMFERVRELGVLMAIGMRNFKIFRMIVYEALCLGVLGTIIGGLVGIGILLPLSHKGVNLGIFSEALNDFGVSAIIYPEISAELVITAMFVMPITSVIAAIYPAIKALRLQPTNAMRYV